MDRTEGDKYGIRYVEEEATKSGTWEMVPHGMTFLDAVLSYRKKHKKNPSSWTEYTGRIWLGPNG